MQRISVPIDEAKRQRLQEYAENQVRTEANMAQFLLERLLERPALVDLLLSPPLPEGFDVIAGLERPAIIDLLRRSES
jgi:hypothetical protein